MIEVIGYLASAMIAISFMMKKVSHIRLINLVGCALFCIYGAVLQAYPVLIANALIILIQLYHIIKRT